MITQPVTLEGLSLNTGSNPVVTIPKSGLASGTVAQISAQQNPDDQSNFGPVNISNLIVDGSKSGVTCSDTSYLVGLEYSGAYGTLENLEVRNQSPGGCGTGIRSSAVIDESSELVIRNNYIHDFDGVRISIGNTVPSFTITSNSVASAIGSGIILDGPGTAANNIISVGGQIGLELGSVYCCDTATYNTITGAVTGIQIDSDQSPET